MFLLRVYRSTLTRTHVSRVVSGDRMHIRRRISSAFKDIPGGQLLGPIYDYVHRLLDFDLAEETEQELQERCRQFEVLLRRRSRVQPVMRRRNNMEMDNRTPVVEGKHIDGGQP